MVHTPPSCPTTVPDRRSWSWNIDSSPTLGLVSSGTVTSRTPLALKSREKNGANLTSKDRVEPLVVAFAGDLVRTPLHNRAAASVSAVRLTSVTAVVLRMLTPYVWQLRRPCPFGHGSAAMRVDGGAPA